MDTCARCGRKLVPDEIGLTKKLINRGTTTFYCLSCLAQHFGCSEELLERKIEQFRLDGCTLFAKVTDKVKNAGAF